MLRRSPRRRRASTGNRCCRARRPTLSRIGFQRGDGVGDQWEFAIVHHHGLGRVLAGFDGFSQHQRDRFSNKTNAIGCKQRPIGLWCRTAIGTREVDAAWDRRHVRQVSGSEHGYDAGHGARCCRIDAGDRGMGMVRVCQHRMQHAGWTRVRAVVAFAGQQPGILSPANRSASASLPSAIISCCDNHVAGW